MIAAKGPERVFNVEACPSAWDSAATDSPLSVLASSMQHIVLRADGGQILLASRAVVHWWGTSAGGNARVDGTTGSITGGRTLPE